MSVDASGSSELGFGTGGCAVAPPDLPVAGADAFVAAFCAVATGVECHWRASATAIPADSQARLLMGDELIHVE
jgi:hypothetical protein